MENEKPNVKYDATTDSESASATESNQVVRLLQNFPIEVTTPQGKKLIFETPKEAAKYLPIDVERIQHVLTGILIETNGYKVRYCRERRY